jgi:murein DD-endopeptidase MepM/ murein hydrolase activator NlpD
MIIHANGLATLYAHMSRLDVVQDQYVTRGQVIGLSGGRAGSPGAGFSTGPHLHFEVREDGIPVDPYKYLP